LLCSRREVEASTLGGGARDASAVIRRRRKRRSCRESAGERSGLHAWL
jgi:hypothetical protein